MDEADIAQRNQEHLEQVALRMKLESMPRGMAASECEECGDAIPQARRNAAPGCTRCLPCQERHERRLKGNW
jgi:phage/conjugal plasmid C-4 type zinc finger TraR family protein